MLTLADTLILQAVRPSSSVSLRSCCTVWEPACIVEITGLCQSDFCKDKRIALKNAWVWMIEKFLSPFNASSREGPPNGSV